MNLSEVVPANSNARTQSERHGPAVVQSATLTKADVERREKLQRIQRLRVRVAVLTVRETIRSMGQKRLLTARQAVVLARREKKKIRIQKKIRSSIKKRAKELVERAGIENTFSSSSSTSLSSDSGSSSLSASSSTDDETEASAVSASESHNQEQEPTQIATQKKTRSDSGVLESVQIPLVTPSVGFKWTLGQRIGSGSNSVVYKGLNATDGSLVAIKQIYISNNEEAVLIRREVDILSGLSHPNIVKYLGVDTDGSSLYILTEWVSGGSVAQQLAQFGPLPEPLAARHTAQIVAGLIFLHSSGVAHCDIKGQNVLVSRNGVLKLADFGAARQFTTGLYGDGNPSKSQRNKSNGGVFGTPAFIAPEAIRCTIDFDDKADIWSLGCTVVQMVTGCTPWQTRQFETVFELLQHVAETCEAPPCPNVSSALKEFLGACFQKKPSSRPSAAELRRLPFIVQAVESRKGTAKIRPREFSRTQDPSSVRSQRRPSLESRFSPTPKGRMGSQRLAPKIPIPLRNVLGRFASIPHTFDLILIMDILCTSPGSGKRWSPRQPSPSS